MDKVAILTASRVEPSVSITAGSHSNIIAALGPTLQYAIWLQNALGSASIFVCLHAYFLASVAVASTLYASKIFAIQAFLATQFGTFQAIAMSRKVAWLAWNSKQSQMVRNKLFHELAVFILGGGNHLILMVFWPGWLVVGGTSFALWHVCG